MQVTREQIHNEIEALKSQEAALAAQLNWTLGAKAAFERMLQEEQPLKVAEVANTLDEPPA